GFQPGFRGETRQLARGDPADMAVQVEDVAAAGVPGTLIPGDRLVRQAVAGEAAAIRVAAVERTRPGRAGAPRSSPRLFPRGVVRAHEDREVLDVRHQRRPVLVLG